MICTKSEGTKSRAKWWGWVECGGDPLGIEGCVGWGWRVGDLQNYCRWVLEMPEVAGGWFCGRWVVGVGGAKEFEVLFHGVGFRSHRRTEVLDAYLFTSMHEIRTVTEAFQYKYNHYRPHGSLNDMAPIEFKEYRKSLTWCYYNRGKYRHVLFNESIVAVTHGNGPTEGLRSWSINGNDVAGLVVGGGGAGSLWNLKYYCRCVQETPEIPNCWTCE